METITTEGIDLDALGPWYAAESTRLVLDGDAHEVNCPVALTAGASPTRASGWHWAKLGSRYCQPCVALVTKEKARASARSAPSAPRPDHFVSKAAQLLSDFERDAHLPAPPALAEQLDAKWRALLGGDSRLAQFAPAFGDLLARRVHAHEEWVTSGAPEDLLLTLAVKERVWEDHGHRLDEPATTPDRVPLRFQEVLEAAGAERALFEAARADVEARPGSSLVWCEGHGAPGLLLLDDELVRTALAPYQAGTGAWVLPNRLLPAVAHLAPLDPRWDVKGVLDVTDVEPAVLETTVRLVADGEIAPTRALELAAELV